jgi:catechol 2,3-dioxygenase-like lactoylglutathione lyase family enzyme
MPSEFHQTIPFLACADVAAAIAFYVEKLGFEKDWTWGEPPTDGGVWRGHVRLYFMRNEELAARVHGSELMLQVSPLADVYKEHLSRNAPIRSGIKEEPWGVREYSITDPNGYRLRFYEPLHETL